MTRIFISYSRQDKTIAEYIAAELHIRGAEVFIDYQKIIGGENFIGRLGHEVAACNFFVLLLSPRSVASKWVQAEVAWALHNNKPIVPVLLEPTSMVDFFFLINVQQIDFTRWSVDGKVDEAVGKLAVALELPAQPTRAEPRPELLVQANPSIEAVEPEPEATLTPAFARSDLSELFMTAVEVASEDPEQAIFLYQRILEIDPHYMRGQAQEFVRHEEQRLKSARLARMLAQAQAALKVGEWSRVKQIGQDMLALDQSHSEAERIVAIATKNAECEPLYEQAVIAAERGRWKAVTTLMRDIRETCPDYGDPAGLLRPIRSELIALLHEQTKLKGHKKPVNCVAFSPDGSLLASASGWTVKLWEIPERRRLTTLSGHRNYVLSLAFSPDGSVLASGSEDKKIKLWEMPEGLEVGTLIGHKDAVYSIAFSPDGSVMASSSQQVIKLWKMSERQELVTLDDHEGSVTSVSFSPNGSLLASAAGDGTIKLWEIPSGLKVATLKGHNYPVRAVTFSPDGALLASASADNTIKLWGLG